MPAPPRPAASAKSSASRSSPGRTKTSAPFCLSPAGNKRKPPASANNQALVTKRGARNSERGTSFWPLRVPRSALRTHMKILVANLGSTSFKYRLFDMTDERVLARGGVERIGAERSRCYVEARDTHDESLHP